MRTVLDAEDLSNRYSDWVKEATSFKQLNTSTVRIDTPFSDNYNDGIVMYAQMVHGSSALLLTDDGWSNENLESHGLYVDRSSRRKQQILTQLASYGVTWNNGKLEITGKLENFGRMKNNLLQAIIFVNDMFVLAPRQTQSYFFEDVDVFFSSHNIRVLKNAAFMGKSGMTHNFEFSIPGSKDVPRKLIKLLSSPNNPVFAKAVFTDIYETKQQQVEPTSFYVFLNDRNKRKEPKELNQDISNLLIQAGATTVPYTKRDNFVNTFKE